jgi:hypothetical protein
MPPAKKKKKRYIDGIFNYCDRWCEPCAFVRPGFDTGEKP